MMTSSITFDRLAYIDRLRTAGMDDAHARALADGLDQALRDEVATRRDLQIMRAEIKLDMEGVRSDIIWKLLSSQIVTALALFTALHFIK